MVVPDWFRGPITNAMRVRHGEYTLEQLNDYIALLRYWKNKGCI